MKLPRDENSAALIKKLLKLGYQIDRQTGSHIRLTTNENGKHSITIPNHNPVKIGTLNSILLEIAEHFKISKDQLINKLW
ncbi:MAG: type II toxin-antitoxin system HicA family toxin [Spirochaetes bacterium]|nr:type II toxin-antitoxin system HicA family toxin [Spirochaetota bacterium]